ncbi:adenine phosphoribosyltransferase 1-like [Macadamia integrifolia]|uniref:adenine phosphoribosyltransferase 1-like n=1 Tax=Macadamia integrifolia TaxID=60698 RepID=UPI001C4FCA2E|nr:adenine phosphoribosyltransferase 1-like [Macadamia integrifolia]
MATSLISSVAAPVSVSSSTVDSRSGSGIGVPRNSFLSGTKLFSAYCPPFPNLRGNVAQRSSISSVSSFDHIPKRFREETETLKYGLMDNNKNAPKYLYGLTPSQMDMFMTEDSLIRKQSKKVTKCFCRKGETASEDGKDQRLERIASVIRVIPDFPKPGIIFQDITTLLLDPKAFKDTIDLFVERYRSKEISVVAGIEARGFIFGPPIALAIGAKFVPMRKPNRLPGEVISEEYTLEYGKDTMEMHVGAVQAGERALVIDDLIATGGSLCAAIRLLERVGVEVVECACVIELTGLKGRDRLGDKPLFVLVSASGV